MPSDDRSTHAQLHACTAGDEPPTVVWTSQDRPMSYEHLLRLLFGGLDLPRGEGR